MNPRYSIIIPVYNRPQELKELLDSLVLQELKNFEVLVVEDGSQEKSDKVAQSFSEKLNIQYFYKENTGPGGSRNYGFERAKGEYFIVLDSDCIVPKQYLQEIEKALNKNKIDAFGGPDAARKDFNTIQKAISYSMTSWLTTGGIRGKKQHVGKYQARSFNMGISKEVFQKTGGFRHMRVSEDIDLSIRVSEAGFNLVLIPEAYVYHKRRSTFQQFFKQTHSFGKGRMNIGKVHKGQVKLVHAFPSAFLLFYLSLLPMFFLSKILFFLQIGFLSFYSLMIFIDAFSQNKNLKIAFLSVWAVLVQFTGYGSGFLKGIFTPKNEGITVK